MDSYFGFLAESGRAFMEPMDMRQALPAVARRAVPRMGDLCAIHLIDAKGNAEASFVAWAEPGNDSTHSLQEKFFTGSEAETAATALLADLGMGTCLTYPLKARGALFGHFILGTLAPGGFAPDQEFLAEEICRNIAFSLEPLVLQNRGRPIETRPLRKDGVLLKAAEKELDSTRDLLRLVVEGANDPVMIFDSTGRALQSNDAAMKCFGFASPEEAADRPLGGILENWLILDPEGRPMRPEDLPIARALSGQGISERLLHAIHRKSGTEHWWEMRAVPKTDQKGRLTHAVLHTHDATPVRSLHSNLKQAHQAVRATRNLLQSTMDALPDSLALFDSQGRILYANLSMSDFLGPDTLQRGFTVPLKDLPDHLGFSDENGDALAWDQLPLWAALRGEDVVDRVMRYWNTKKAKEGWTRMHAVPILDLRGRLVMVATLYHDLTSHKLAQDNRESAAARLRQAHKMEAVSRLAAGIAHDFNNLLTSILGYADLIADSARAHPHISGYAEEIRGSADRAASLTAQLLAFGRRQMLFPLPVDINTRLTTQLPKLEELAGPRVTLVFGPAFGLPMVHVDPIKWDQAVLNLVINAGEAMPQGGQLVLATFFRTLDQALEIEDDIIPPGAYVILEVADTGRGMDAETQARIFEPFFTTKNSVKSGGLGLPMVLGFIRQSGGFIQLQSSPGKGTAFRIFLRAQKGEIQGASPHPGLR